MRTGGGGNGCSLRRRAASLICFSLAFERIRIVGAGEVPVWVGALVLLRELGLVDPECFLGAVACLDALEPVDPVAAVLECALELPVVVGALATLALFDAPPQALTASTGAKTSHMPRPRGWERSKPFTAR